MTRHRLLRIAELIEGALPRECREPYLKVYRQFRHKESGTIVCDNKGPWVIVVFGSDPKLIRRRTLSEIVPLAKALYLRSFSEEKREEAA